MPLATGNLGLHAGKVRLSVCYVFHHHEEFLNAEATMCYGLYQPCRASSLKVMRSRNSKPGNNCKVWMRIHLLGSVCVCVQKHASYDFLVI